MIHEDVQGHVGEYGPSQAPPGFIATPVLQDTLVCILGFLEGMAQGTVPVPSDGSQTRIGGQNPDQMVAPGFQTPSTQPAAATAPHFDSMALPGVT